MPFSPDTPITVAYAVVLFAVCGAAIIRQRLLWPVVAVMVANWLGTRAITAYDAPALLGGLLDLSSAAILIALSRFRAMAVLPVAALFGLMVFSYVMADFGLLERETMWAFADVGAYLQLLVIAGFAADGGSGKLAFLGFGPRRRAVLVRAHSRRVQD